MQSRSLIALKIQVTLKMAITSSFLYTLLLFSIDPSYANSRTNYVDPTAIASTSASFIALSSSKGKAQGPTVKFIPIRTLVETLKVQLQPRRKICHMPMALGKNYLDNIDSNSDGSKNKINSFRDGGTNRTGRNTNTQSRWSFGFGGGNNAHSQGSSSSSSSGIPGTAIRPSSSNGMHGGDNVNNLGPSNNYKMVGGRLKSWTSQSSIAREGKSKILAIKQPQDLLDFVIQDERLSVVKVFASWCKTCQIFDIRYRKLASQIGDKYDSVEETQLVEAGRVRFAEMQFDDPNNEEMCRLLNATKLPYILMYKGSRGKVTDFQCGPSNFQLLIDAVNEFADPKVDKESLAATVVGHAEEEEPEWRVIQEKIQKQVLDPSDDTFSDDNNLVYLTRQKDEEIARLHSELSTLQKEFDQKILSLNEARKHETGLLRDKIDQQAKEYEKERSSLSSQLDQLTKEMLEREKAYRSVESTTIIQLRQDLKQKETDYKAALFSLNSSFTETKDELFKVKNELKYNTNASKREKEDMAKRISLLEEEQSILLSQNKEMEKEIIENRLKILQTTEEANRVLQQLESIKSGKEEDVVKLLSRIQELEAEIALIQSDRGVSDDKREEVEEREREHKHELEFMARRIMELESMQEEWQPVLKFELQQEQSKAIELEETIISVKRDLAERDKLLRMSNKATDILLDQLEGQKRYYEKELKLAMTLSNDLQQAIVRREMELEALQNEFSTLKKMTIKALKAQGNDQSFKLISEHGQYIENRHFQVEQDLQLTTKGEFKILNNKAMESFPDQIIDFGGEDNLDGVEFEMSQESLNKYTSEYTKSNDSIGYYQMLKDVLSNDEVSYNRMAPRKDDPIKTNDVGLTPSPASVHIESIRIPTPQQEFERRLVENPIVPAGAFGASKPTAHFFRSSDAPTMANSLSDINAPANTNDRLPRSESHSYNAPSSFLQRPTSPSPRVVARAGITDNIYAGAGSAASSMSPSPAVPVPTSDHFLQVPTPQLEFERRLAENPIVPAGAFGGSKPTAHFFRKMTPSLMSSRHDIETQPKWNSLDEFEKKRVAAEAYKAFEKQLADRRSQEQKPKHKRVGDVGRISSNANPARGTLLNQEKDRHERFLSVSDSSARNTYDGKSKNKLELEQGKPKAMLEDDVVAPKPKQEVSSASSNFTKIFSQEQKKENLNTTQSKQEIIEKMNLTVAQLGYHDENAKEILMNVTIRQKENSIQSTHEEKKLQPNVSQIMISKVNITKINNLQGVSTKKNERILVEDELEGGVENVVTVKNKEIEEKHLKLLSQCEVSDNQKAKNNIYSQQSPVEHEKSRSEAPIKTSRVIKNQKMDGMKSVVYHQTMTNESTENKSKTDQLIHKENPIDHIKNARTTAKQGVTFEQENNDKVKSEAARMQSRNVDKVANSEEAKHQVVALNDGSKSELGGPLKDLLSVPKEKISKKNDLNY